jgi:Asp-tRNA(Asn)/Glu-tRNA(Gln) amidotransferase A subunit family amidase
MALWQAASFLAEPPKGACTVARLKEAMLEHLVENFHTPRLQLKWTRPRQSLSQCAVPVGCDDGLPQGVQLIGARFREDLLRRSGDRKSGAEPYPH